MQHQLLNLLTFRNLQIFFVSLACSAFALLLVWEKVYLSSTTSTPTLLGRDKVDKAKRILLWNSFEERRQYGFVPGRKTFRENKCEYSNCIIVLGKKTNWEKFAEHFDAIIFNGPEYSRSPMPKPTRRRPHQIFVYFSMESAAFRPAKPHMNGGFFNITMTYRFDSDIFVPHSHVVDYEGNHIAPCYDPKWMDPRTEDDKALSDRFRDIYKKKTKPVAWMVSNCAALSRRREYVVELQKYIKVDVYGACGTLQYNETQSFRMLENDYFFYLAFENSLCEDYITDKARLAYEHDVVPVVMTRVNLTRHLPPGSYVDAQRLSPKQLAEKIRLLMGDPEEYLRHFWWRGMYRFESTARAEDHHMCRLCRMLHERKERKVHDDLETWWHGSKGDRRCEYFDEARRWLAVSEKNAFAYEVP